MKKAFVDIGHEMAWNSQYGEKTSWIDVPPTYLLAEISNRLVILVKNNADLIHQPDLFFVILTFQPARAGVNIWEKSQDALSRDGLSLSGGSSRRHTAREGGREGRGLL